MFPSLIKENPILILLLCVIVFQGCTLQNSDSVYEYTPNLISASKTTITTSTVMSSHKTPVLTRESTTPILTPTTKQSEVPVIATDTVVAEPDTTSLEPPPEGWLAIGSFENYPHTMVDLIRSDGKGWRNIIQDDRNPRGRNWSPDGQLISFYLRRDDGFGEDLYIAHPDGTNIRQITNTPFYKGAHSWSPDGKLIVYSQIIGEGLDFEVDMYAVNVKTGQIIQITDTKGIYEHNPIYSPQGDEIAYYAFHSKEQTHNRYLEIVDIDGGNPRRVLNKPIGGGLTWSPDGEKLAFYSDDVCSNLFVVNRNGSELRQVTDSFGSDIAPAWSPSGEWIAYMSAEECEGVLEGWEIYLIHPDGTNLVQITNNPQRHPFGLAWSPLPALQSGRNYTITKSGDLLNLRDSPSIGGSVIEKLREGEEILIMEGPVEADDYLWWRVRVTRSSREGWVAENPGWFDGEW